MRGPDTQVPISDAVEDKGPDAVGLDAVAAEPLVGARTFLSLFEPHADASAAAASRGSSGNVLFMVVIFAITESPLDAQFWRPILEILLFLLEKTERRRTLCRYPANADHMIT